MTPRALLITVLLSATPALFAVPLDIDFTNRVQTMDGIGANSYCFMWNGNGSGDNWDWDAVKYVFDELDLHYIRLAPWLSWWETSNDNGDCRSINWSGFKTVHQMVDWYELPYARWLMNKGIDAELGVWGFADWLQSSNPPGAHAEAAELIAAYLKYFMDRGVTLPVYEVKNEPQLTPEHYPNAVALATGAVMTVEALDYFGITNIILHGPNHHAPSGAAAWGAPWFGNPMLAARTTAVSFHTYWDNSKSHFDAIWALAQQYDKPVWATEVTGQHWTQATGWQFTEPNWTCCMDGALRYYRALAWSHASRLYQWTILGHDAVVGTHGEKLPAFYRLKHFANFIPPGAQFVTCASGQSQVYPLFFALPDGTFSLIVINNTTSTRTCEVTTNDVPPLVCTEWFTSRDGSYYVTNAPVVPAADGSLSFSLPGKSISSMRLVPEPAAAVALAIAAVIGAQRARHTPRSGGHSRCALSSMGASTP